MPPSPNQPVRLGTLWVLLTLDNEPSRNSIELHVSIGGATTEPCWTPPPQPVSGRDLSVQVLTQEGPSLVATQAPGAGLLPGVATKGPGTAFGQYTFDNSAGLHPTEVRVTLRGNTQQYDVSGVYR